MSKKTKKVKELPLSGSEHVFRLRPWTDKGPYYNNCYAYAVHDYKTFRIHKSIPGDVSGLSSLPHTYTHCKGLAKRVISDNPGKVYQCKNGDRCKKGFYKIFMVVAPTNKFGNSTGDFHFYKQHGYVYYKVQNGDTCRSIAEFFKIPYCRVQKNTPLTPGKKILLKVNLFSHKRGWGTGPLLTDACGKMIKDPTKSCRNYSHNYSKVCSAFCVRNKGIRVGPKSPKN